jgi:hypothetical protein
MNLESQTHAYDRSGATGRQETKDSAPEGKIQSTPSTAIPGTHRSSSPFSDFFSMGHGVYDGDETPWVMGHTPSYAVSYDP